MHLKLAVLCCAVRLCASDSLSRNEVRPYNSFGSWGRGLQISLSGAQRVWGLGFRVP